MSKRNWLLVVAVVVIVAAVAVWQSMPEPKPPEPVEYTSPWGADYFPNVPLTTQDSETMYFFEDVIKDKVVMINLIYTSCRDSCPLETARLKQVYKLLEDRVGKDVFFYSITIDPEHDTPAVLKDYMEKFKIGPGWVFLTGKEEDITLIRKKLGVYRDDQSLRDNLEDHDISLVIGNQKTGQWIKSSPFDNSHMLATKVGGWLHNWKQPSKGGRSYAEAPDLREISRGESLWRSRCSACHTIGGGDVESANAGAIGPDLIGVTSSRDRAWLKRFIAEPDRMIDEQDPIALALLKQYNGVIMPNLRLNELEVEALLSYIEEENLRLQAR